MRRVNNKKTISQQLGNMRAKYSHFKSTMKRNSIVVTGKLRPTSRSKEYSFLLEYKHNEKPKIKIVSPSLIRNSKGEEIPHMYFQKHLCLYRPKYNEFKTSDFLSDTIIPWIALWLYYYEQWHITGKWLGGGEHPNQKKQKNAKKR